MDQEFELGRAKWLGPFLALFGIACFISYEEAIYLIRGNSTQAKITDVSFETPRYFGIPTGERLLVDYEFTEADGTHRTGRDFRSKDWEIPDNRTVAIRFTSGVNGTSRFAGHVNWFGLGFFVISLTWVGCFGYALWRERRRPASHASARKPEREQRKSPMGTDINNPGSGADSVPHPVE
jgi:hypothetical protein